MLAGPRGAKFTRLKELIFFDSSSGVSSPLDQPSSSHATTGRVPSSCVMVYDYVQHDLLGIIYKRIRFNLAQIKYIMKEVLEAVDALHTEHIEHGHIKSEFMVTQLPTSI